MPMNFKDNTPIYKQIIDYCFGRILSAAWVPDERIPSVRELALALGVNTHTVLKALDYLQNHQIIFPKRGMGYYLAPDAPGRVNATRREEFFNERLPELLAEMKMLSISIEEVATHLHKL